METALVIYTWRQNLMSKLLVLQDLARDIILAWHFWHFDMYTLQENIDIFLLLAFDSIHFLHMLDTKKYSQWYWVCRLRHIFCSGKWKFQPVVKIASRLKNWSCFCFWNEHLRDFCFQVEKHVKWCRTSSIDLNFLASLVLSLILTYFILCLQFQLTNSMFTWRVQLNIYMSQQKVVSSDCTSVWPM